MGNITVLTSCFNEAKTTLALIPQTSKAFELAKLLNHYLITK